MNTNIRTIGASIGTAVVSSIVTSHPGPHGLPAESGYTTSFTILAITGVAALAVALLVPATRRPAPSLADEPVEAVPELTPVEA
jgi:hypothetical protein